MTATATKTSPENIYYFHLCYFSSRLFQLAQLLKNGELSGNLIGRSGIQVKKENEKFTVVRSRSPQNLKISRCCFAEDGKEMYQRTCRVIVSAH